MDAQTCIRKLGYVGVLNFATVDEKGAPQVRNISAIHFEEDALYFFTARGKEFCKQLLADGRVQILGYTMYKESIRLSGKAVPVPDHEQENWIHTIFEEQPYLENVYPGDTKKIGIVFCVRGFTIEYFNLGVNPIFRDIYEVGEVKADRKRYEITDACIGCGKCRKVCPQKAVEKGERAPYRITQEHCLHCGNCREVCPVGAVEYCLSGSALLY